MSASPCTLRSKPHPYMPQPCWPSSSYSSVCTDQLVLPAFFLRVWLHTTPVYACERGYTHRLTHKLLIFRGKCPNCPNYLAQSLPGNSPHEFHRDHGQEGSETLHHDQRFLNGLTRGKLHALKHITGQC